ncbi:uncharacterized protein LAESUDRAFT_764356 [Laetiporus sulphureus 93-53]|uniref:Uncharacterized protein n=1 Tax=Laetiporus sulphureus 93-53 TaxID=1314785 RepID=A0A165BCQ5_9APHY|nr:uncharacterized protein LAESUDRAFT_764356 [Laetiporus sulphureus 93-53]KZT00753.1 hypothetical protein LAESUDRAFT_764356 [Laetiporus sulphureus 93-53]
MLKQREQFDNVSAEELKVFKVLDWKMMALAAHAPLLLKHVHGKARLPYSKRVAKQQHVFQDDQSAQPGPLNPLFDEPIPYRQQHIPDDDESSQSGSPNSLLDKHSDDDEGSQAVVHL